MGKTNNIKRYSISILVTFVAGFVISVIPELDSFTLESFKDGTVIGVIFAGARTGIKFVFEKFIFWYNK